MPLLNPHFFSLGEQYLFQEIEKHKQNFLKANPKAPPLINLGIGDIARPIAPKICQAISHAALEMADEKKFKGYGPGSGYEFLKKAIALHEYPNLGIEAEEIFISDGSKGDTAHILDIFSPDNRVGLSDPAYPVYLESSVVKGMGKDLYFLPCLKEHDFLPSPPNTPLDLIFLCSPNNPTGTAFSYQSLKKWVEYAKSHQALIFYDSAYSCFIQGQNNPRSIYEIPGAKDVAIEFRSYSKSLGFTGLRLAYTVVPKNLLAKHQSANSSVWKIWKRHQDMKFGGASYPIQKGAYAYYQDPEARAEVQSIISSYLENARRLKKTLSGTGLEIHGGQHSPYIWLKTPLSSTSWEYFHTLMEDKQIIGIPGKGFGEHGEGFLRLSCFCNSFALEKAIKRFQPFTSSSII